MRDPQPTVRLVYRVGQSTAKIEEVRNPQPGQPMVHAVAGSTQDTRIEDDGVVQRLYIYTSDGSRILSAAWGTAEVWVFVNFQPAVNAPIGRDFVRSMR